MLVPFSWLREFTPYEGTAEALGARLTMVGLELDGIINPFAGIEDIIVGQVVQCVPHPDSDHMHCCRVDMGNGVLEDIICGAPNVAAGQKVAVAPVGASLPDGTKIKKAKLRGQPSHGMICSERELGLSEDHSGIMVLPEWVRTGQPLTAALSLETSVLDLSVTPNRSDCLSILGIARETAAVFGLPLHVPDLPLIPDKSEPDAIVPITIENPDLCGLYSGRVLAGAKVAPSPMRIRYRLIAAGIRPISNIVDVTNYILVECGQPLHAFDLDRLDGQEIFVRAARQGERLTTLDGKERELSEADIAICDRNGPVALGGVMGGENSGITETTKNIFIESAVFDPARIRRTSRRFGLQSEASFRFERGVDQRRTIWALDRAVALMASIAGGLARTGLSISEPRPFVPARIEFSPKNTDALLGVAIDSDFQRKTLAGLGCAIENGTDGKWLVIQPSWRPDLAREADLIEEVGRIYGLDTIEPVLPPVRRKLEDNLAPAGVYAFWQLVRQWGASLGLHEVINYSFVGQKELDLLGYDREGRVSVLNPLSADQDVLRTGLAPGLLRDLENNLAYGAAGARLFELANVFAKDGASETGVAESGRLGVLLCGARHEYPWPKREEDFDYADIKGALENLLAFLHLEAPVLETQKDHAFLSPCVSVSIGKTFLGHMGRIRPAIAKEYNAQKPVWLMELDLEALRLCHEQAVVRFRALPVYPPAKRDMTVTAPESMQASAILEEILLAKAPILEGAVLVDCFQAGQAERSLTFRLVFRHPARTLKDAEADREREKIAERLRDRLQVKI